MDTLVVHHHELGLKGKNRSYFEKVLVRNLRRALSRTGYDKMRMVFGRVVIDMSPGAHTQEAAERAARLFGVAYVGVGKKVTPDMDALAGVGLELLEERPFESFAVRARRTYSSFQHKSSEIHEVVGRHLQDATGGRVDLSHPDATIWFELFGKTAVAYRTRIEGTGGLPAGTSGRMITLLSGGIDSPVAAWRMARRGAEIEMLHFHGRPFSDHSSVTQAVDLTAAFNRYNVSTTLHLVPLGDAQREIVMSAPSDMRVVLYRRAMLRIAAELAAQRGALALVTGDSLGQVASQTIENISTVDAASPGIQILRPLVGMTKQEIVDDAQRIGTYAISTRKYQDCCVLFEPRDPVIRARPQDAERAEATLDMPVLVGKALAGIETRRFELPDPTGRGTPARSSP